MEVKVKEDKLNLNSELDSEKNKLKREQESEDNKESQEELDPTHFGDWQVDCRAIDF